MQFLFIDFLILLLKLEREFVQAARGGEPTEKEEEARANMENLGVPLIQINVANPELKLDSCVFEARVLPSYEEVCFLSNVFAKFQGQLCSFGSHPFMHCNFQLHEGLGMGTTGPPVPPPATFSVVPFPIKRKPHIGADPSVNFSFIAAGLEDPLVLQIFGFSSLRIC